MSRILKSPGVHPETMVVRTAAATRRRQRAPTGVEAPHGNGGGGTRPPRRAGPATADPIAAARAEAEAIIAAAKAEAARIRAAAEDTAERAIALESRAAAKAAGAEAAAARLADAKLAEAAKEAAAARAAAEAEGRQAGAAAIRRDLTEHLETAFKIAQQASAERQAILRQAEPAIIRLAVDICRRILARELTQDPALLTQLAEQALARAAGPMPVRLRLHPQDMDLLGPQLLDLERRYADSDIEVVPDPHVGRGGCVVDTRSGTVDVSLDTQLATIEAALLDLTVHEEPAESEAEANA